MWNPAAPPGVYAVEGDCHPCVQLCSSCGHHCCRSWRRCAGSQDKLLIHGSSTVGQSANASFRKCFMHIRRECRPDVLRRGVAGKSGVVTASWTQRAGLSVMAVSHVDGEGCSERQTLRRHLDERISTPNDTRAEPTAWAGCAAGPSPAATTAARAAAQQENVESANRGTRTRNLGFRISL